MSKRYSLQARSLPRPFTLMASICLESITRSPARNTSLSPGRKRTVSPVSSSLQLKSPYKYFVSFPTHWNNSSARQKCALLLFVGIIFHYLAPHNYKSAAITQASEKLTQRLHIYKTLGLIPRCHNFHKFSLSSCSGAPKTGPRAKVYNGTIHQARGGTVSWSSIEYIFRLDRIFLFGKNNVRLLFPIQLSYSTIDWLFGYHTPFQDSWHPISSTD